MDFDDVLEELGEFGRYQMTNYLLICLPVFFGAANSLSYVFTAGIPSYRCFVPGCDDANDPQFDPPWVSSAIPPAPNRPEDAAFVPHDCRRYVPEGNLTINGSECQGVFSSREETCASWVFEDDEHTIALSVNYSMFQVFVFINALGTAGVYPLAFIIAVELVGRSKREMSGIVLNYFYALGEAAVGLIAWLTKNWVHIQFVVSAPALIFAIYHWFIPESARWLLAKRQNNRAGSIIRKAASMNGVVLSERLLNNFAKDVPQRTKAEEAADQDPKSISMTQTILEICRSRKLLLRSLNLFFCWAANAFVYYGLSVNSTSLGGNKYLNFALVCLVEIPGYTLSWVAMNRLGRRRSLAASLLLCSITCVGAAFVPEGMYWAEVFLFLVGKLGITSSFGVVCVFTAELYPTTMRSAGVGVSSTVARIGAMIAPFAPLLGKFYHPLPLLTFAIVSFVACLMSLLFPETLGKKLPDTIEDIENL